MSTGMILLVSVVVSLWVIAIILVQISNQIYELHQALAEGDET